MIESIDSLEVDFVKKFLFAEMSYNDINTYLESSDL